MAYSENNAPATEVLRLIKKYPGYSVLTNLPYFKGVYIVRKLKNGKLEILQKFESNYEAIQAMITPGWHPDPKLINIPKKGLFDLWESTNSKSLTKDYLDKISQKIYDLKEIGKATGASKIYYKHLNYLQNYYLNKFEI